MSEETALTLDVRHFEGIDLDREYWHHYHLDIHTGDREHMTRIEWWMKRKIGLKVKED